MSGDIHKSPSVSVIVPAFNAGDTLDEQLLALRTQVTSFDYEVIVADNGSTDTTCDVVTRSMATWPQLRLVNADGVRGSAHARNIGARAAMADVVAFADADDVVENTWLAALVEQVAAQKIVAGRVRATEINDAAVVASRPRTAHDVGRDSAEVPEFAPTSSMAMLRADYLALGGLDETFLRSHDVEFSYRARAQGFSIIRAADAVIDYRYRQTATSLATQAFKAGRVGARLRKLYPQYTKPRTGAQAIRSSWWVVSRLPLLTLTSRRQLWVGNAARAAGRLVGSVQYRVWYV